MYVIFGASGKVGRTTAAALRRAGKPVRAVVRHALQGDGLAKLGCEVVLADLTDAASVASAIVGASAVQILCPVPVGDPHPASTMHRMIDVAAEVLRANPPPAVLALSDYGAELAQAAGLTLLFHQLEARLKPLPTRLTLLRSAEHAQNWAAMLPVMLATGVLPCLHHPLTRPFPFIATEDVGAFAAELLTDEVRSTATRIVSVEGPRRVSMVEIARAFSEVSGRQIAAQELPRAAWAAVLQRGGLSEQHAQLITDLYDLLNAGHIDVEKGATDVRLGKTELRDVVTALIAQHARA